jgi:hypothetical protein
MCVIVFVTTATCPYPEPPQSTPPPPIPFLKYFNILPTTTCLPSCLFPYGFPTKTQYRFAFYPTHTTFPAHLILRDSIAESSVSTNQEATHYTIPPTHSKTATTVIGQTVCGRREEYVRIACWRMSSSLLTAIIIHCALILLYGRSRRLRKIFPPS